MWMMVFRGAAGCNERMFGTVEYKQPIFLHANFADGIITCRICYQYLACGRYWLGGLLGV